MAKAKQTEQVQATKTTPLKKITVATVYGKVSVRDIPEGEELMLCRIAGFASGVKQGESNYGPWKALQGEFASTNYQTGEMFVAATAIVPGAMGEMLTVATENALGEDASAKVRFSVDVSVKVSERDANKYEYVVRPVIENDVKSPALLLLGVEGE